MEAREYEQLVKALRHCVTRRNGCVTCAGCQISSKNGDVIECINALHKDAAAAIEEMQAEVKQAAKRNAELHAELEKWVSAAEKAAQPHWVSVNERLPEHGQRILICLRFTCIDGTEEPARTVYGYFSNYENRGRRYWTWEDEEVQCQCCMSGEEEEPDEEYGAFRITHWMPLPSAPEPPQDGNLSRTFQNLTNEAEPPQEVQE